MRVLATAIPLLLSSVVVLGHRQPAHPARHHELAHKRQDDATDDDVLGGLLGNSAVSGARTWINGIVTLTTVKQHFGCDAIHPPNHYQRRHQSNIRAPYINSGVISPHLFPDSFFDPPVIFAAPEYRCQQHAGIGVRQRDRVVDVGQHHAHLICIIF